VGAAVLLYSTGTAVPAASLRISAIRSTWSLTSLPLNLVITSPAATAFCAGPAGTAESLTPPLGSCAGSRVAPIAVRLAVPWWVGVAVEMIWPATRLARLIGMAKPMPMLPLAPEPGICAIELSTPTTGRRRRPADRRSCRVDRRVGLQGRGVDRLLAGGVAALVGAGHHRPVDRADDAGGDRALQVQRRSEGDHRVADGHLVGVTERYGREAGLADLEDRDVGVGSRPTMLAATPVPSEKTTRRLPPLAAGSATWLLVMM